MTTTTTRPMPTWFTDLAAETQATITEMVNEQGIPLHDIADFVEEYGAKAFVDGHYETWVGLSEDGYDEGAIEAFVGEFGVWCIGSFVDAYYGQYGSEEEFAAEHAAEMSGMRGLDNLPYWVAIDWQETWENLSEDFSYVDGYVFNKEF